MNVLQKQKLDPTFGGDVVLAKRECDSVIKHTLRLNSTESAFITEAAEKADMFVSAFIRMVLRVHIGKVSILNNNEVSALYQSNYQLGRIGQNMNQIAHALNAMQATTVTTEKIAEVEAVIRGGD
ncbi:MAG: plasmid mobilization protein [Advenella sp.]|uniref:plasmid mobilization protein n=1 Tax=Advenella sp. TaxID=1872388 RepID=UPI003F9B02FF